MPSPLFRAAANALAILCLVTAAFGSAYNARPKLVVIITIDQFRGDYIERYRDQFIEGGFRLFLDHGAYFSNCNYDYANTRTAPGHATLFSGTYSSGHGIIANEWWDPQKKRMVTSVEDDSTKLLGIAGGGTGSSPHNLLSDTVGDELKIATQGKSRVFGIALKDRAAVLPAGFAGDGAYWIDRKSGAWVTSTYYGQNLPQWVDDFNQSKRADKYLNKEWKDASGRVFSTTTLTANKGFYEVVGSTPFANDYELEFARELVIYEKLGKGDATDLLSVSLSANDILGHQVGPDTPEMQAMALSLDRQLAEFFNFLGHQVGLANVWIALSADHGVSPVPAVIEKLRIPSTGYSSAKLLAQLNATLSTSLTGGRSTEFVRVLDYPMVWLNEEAFAAVKMKEEDAEKNVGEALEKIGMRGYYTRSQLASGSVPNDAMGLKYLHSYSPLGGWYVLGIPAPFTIGTTSGTDHASPYSYDTHVPLLFYGLPFQAGTYRARSEPVDLAATLASVLGINAPTHAVGRVLTEALSGAKRPDSPSHPATNSDRGRDTAIDGGAQ